MKNIFNTLWADDAAAIISAELVLVLTIAVMFMIVGLHELTSGIINELADISDAIGHLNQSYEFMGFQSIKDEAAGTYKSRVYGAFFEDGVDVCDDCNGSQNLLACDLPAIGETP